MRSSILLGSLFIAIVLLAQSALLADTPASRPAIGNFSGVWQTTYGDMSLKQTGDTVEGTYGEPGSKNAIMGKVLPTGRLAFTYIEPQSTTGEGWFELTADGASLKGQWREKGQADWLIWIARRPGSVDPVSPATASNNFTGVWETSFGRMRLKQLDNQVTGIFEFAGRSTLDGTVAGRKLTFSYVQGDGEKGTGTFDLSANVASFAGTWQGKKQEVANGGNWTGNRLLPTAGRIWLVILEAPWEAGLVENEYSFGLMLRTFFARVPRVAIRHRLLNGEPDFKRWTAEIPYLPDPVVLYISSHGSKEGINVGGKTIGSKAMADAIRDADNLTLLHFGSCLVAGGAVPKEIQKELSATNKLPITGFTKVADWAGSAVVDFTYLDLIFSRGLAPADAVKQTKKMLSFANEAKRPGDAIEPTGLIVVEP